MIVSHLVYSLSLHCILFTTDDVCTELVLWHVLSAEVGAGHVVYMPGGVTEVYCDYVMTVNKHSN